MIVNIEGNEWAQGCGDCSYGLVLAPELSRKFSTVQQRKVEANVGRLTYCDCKAGAMYRKFLTGIDIEWAGPTAHWDSPEHVHHYAEEL